jgi:hypothetical protein
MGQTKQIKCSVCGQTIRTFTGALAMRKAPVVCRRCFGHQTYESNSSRVASVISSVVEQPAGTMEA